MTTKNNKALRPSHSKRVITRREMLWCLMVSLFIIGLAIMAGYSIHIIVSEFLARAQRERAVTLDQHKALRMAAAYGLQWPSAIKYG